MRHIDVAVDVTQANLGDHEVLVLRPNQKPVAKTTSYQQVAEHVTLAMEKAAYRDGVNAALGYIDLARRCFANANLKKGAQAVKPIRPHRDR